MQPSVATAADLKWDVEVGHHDHDDPNNDDHHHDQQTKEGHLTRRLDFCPLPKIFLTRNSLGELGLFWNGNWLGFSFLPFLEHSVL